MNTLKVVTYNIHKGYSRRHGITVHALREALRAFGSDLVFLQEVQGLSARRSRRHPQWPSMPQYEYLADTLWTEFAYGRNAVYDDGHHGNAILSRHPIVAWRNTDISQSRFEQRGLLHCEIAIAGWPGPLHCINVHMGLFAGWRRRQFDALRAQIERTVPPSAPLIVAGDFNDWGQHALHLLPATLGLDEAFTAIAGRPARSYPARMPLLRLDRIYTRGFRVETAHVHHGPRVGALSDHAALSATLRVRT